MAKNSDKDLKSKPQGENPKAANKKKKKRKKHPKLYVMFLTIFCVFVAGMLTFLTVGISVLSFMSNGVNGEIDVNLDDYKNSQNQTSIMYGYDSDNDVVELARLHGTENRIWVDYEDMPENLLWAFICLEDKRFYDHDGVDWKRTIAVFIKTEYEGQGASTITQQLIKNLTDNNSATYNRKFHEIVSALNLEKNYSKKDIIEAYLNTVSLGAGCYGVKTAAETYFGKEVKDLTLLECATLAGITKAPYTKNPYSSMEKCMERKNRCLKAMWEECGKISKKTYDKLIKQEPKIQPKENSTVGVNEDQSEVLSWYEEYVIDQVISDLQEKYDYDYNEAWRKVYYGGLKIYAAVDLDVQKTLESIYKNRSGFPSSFRDSRGELPQSAMTIMDYQGRIVALVGGTGAKTANRTYNRATDFRAKRQPGSSIKPLSAYAPAVDLGLVTATSPILEKAISKYNAGQDWPRNFNGDHGSGKYVTVENALVRSLNTVPARIIHEMLTIDTSLRYCNEKFHLNLSKNDANLSSLAVGGTNTGVTTLEMAAAFATFGNGGRYYEPYSYYKVTDRNGEVILDNTDNQPEQAIRRETASSLLSMLTKAVTSSSGTGYGSYISRFQTFAKTGTTSDNCDKWYCGGTPHYVTAVWYGFDYRADMHTGTSNPAKTVFSYVFKNLHTNLPAKTFSQTIEEVDNSLKVDTQ